MFRTIALYALLCAVAHGASLYVSPAGDDGNPGTKDKPLRTLEAARDSLRKAKGGATVWLMPGRHFRGKPFELDERDSGTADAPIVYKAVAGEVVFIDGGKIIPPDACKPVTDGNVRARFVSEARDRIVQIDLKAQGVSDFGTLGPRGFARPYRAAPLEIFINGEAQAIARWPNAGEKHLPLGKVIDKGSVPRTGDFSFRGGIFEAGTPRVKRWASAADLYVSGIFNYGYADDTIPVAKLDVAKGTIATTHPHLYGFVRRSFTAWYALNLIEEIDLPGEYCVDKASGTLYLYPPCDLADALIQVSLAEEPMVVMEGTSHVRFENITFENARGVGIYMERGSGNAIAGCTLRNLGILGVQIGQGTTALPDGKHDAHGTSKEGLPFGKPASRVLGSMQNYIYANTAWNREAGTGHTVLSCDIHDTGAGGVVLGGGDRKTLAPAGNSVRNCNIYHVNRWDRMYRTPVNIDGVGNTVANNHLHDCPGQAILLHGNDHVIELNRMNHVVTNMSDQAAIYMGRDPSESGNVFRHNFFHDIYNAHAGGHGVQAIFFDDCCIFGAAVEGNVFYRTGSTGVVKFNGGGLSPIRNNIVIDCPALAQGARDNTGRVVAFMKSPLGQKRLREAVDITKPPHSTKYPIVAQVYAGKAKVTTPVERNYVVKGDYSQFLDAKALNFQLKEGSKVYTDIAGFQRIPFEKIGLTIDAYRTALPVLAPRISPVGCAFIGKVEVTISSDPARKDMAVRYTLDGREPSRRSPLYVRPFELTQGATVRARAFSTASARVAPSTVAIASYRKVEFKTGDPLYLSDLPEEGGAFAHGGVKKDANYAATGDFRLAGKTYKKGLMTCPEAAGGGGRSHVAYALSSLPLKFTRFKAMVGIDGAMGTRGSVVFLVDVHRGGKWVEAFKSAVLRGGKAAVVDVDIAGAEKLRLRTTDAGDNIHADHAVWADARVE